MLHLGDLVRVFYLTGPLVEDDHVSMDLSRPSQFGSRYTLLLYEEFVLICQKDLTRLTEEIKPEKDLAMKKKISGRFSLIIFCGFKLYIC